MRIAELERINNDLDSKLKCSKENYGHMITEYANIQRGYEKEKKNLAFTLRQQDELSTLLARKEAEIKNYRVHIDAGQKLWVSTYFARQSAV